MLKKQATGAVVNPSRKTAEFDDLEMGHGHAGQQSRLWVFGYGSLIWRPGFDHDEQAYALLFGYQRRFCQASHDHRGTPERPGRVVTLVPEQEAICKGMAYRLPQEECEDVLTYLDEREQDGYERLYMALTLSDGRTVSGLTWIAREGNPSWRGGEAIETVAALIAERHGESGRNSDYLYELERSLDQASMSDPYVSDLARRVRALQHSI